MVSLSDTVEQRIGLGQFVFTEDDTKIAAKARMILNRNLLLFCLFFFVLAGQNAYSETPLDYPHFNPQYEINSESVIFPDENLVQSDLRLLAGNKFSTLNEYDLRLAGGAYLLYQDAATFSPTWRHGGFVQAKFDLWKHSIFLVYEFHQFKLRSESPTYDETRYGLYAGYFSSLSPRLVFDFYAESFFIPRVSDQQALSSARASLWYDTQILDHHQFQLISEIYIKDSPPFWGGSRHDLRMGLGFLSQRLLTEL